jgi:DNA replication protein DnaC
LAQFDFLHAGENVVLLGPPGTGKPHVVIAIRARARLAGQQVLFAFLLTPGIGTARFNPWD